jgi:predicted small secreted protein
MNQHMIFNRQPETTSMQTKILIALGTAAAVLAGSSIAQAADDAMRNELDQRNQIWSMQGATDGSYTGNAERNRVQTRTREQVRTRTYQGAASGTRYGQGYESRQGGGGFTSAQGGGSRSGAGGGRR